LAIAKSTANHTPALRLLKTGFSSTEAREKLETLRAQLSAQLAQNRAQALAAEGTFCVKTVVLSAAMHK
jgi:hypothetical protein